MKNESWNWGITYFSVSFLLLGEAWCIWHNVLMLCWVWHGSLYERNKSAPEQCCLMWYFDILKLFSAFEARLQSDVSDSPPLYLMVVLTCPCVPANARIQVLFWHISCSNKGTNPPTKQKTLSIKYPKWWWGPWPNRTGVTCLLCRSYRDAALETGSGLLR